MKSTQTGSQNKNIIIISANQMTFTVHDYYSQSDRCNNLSVDSNSQSDNVTTNQLTVAVNHTNVIPNQLTVAANHTNLTNQNMNEIKKLIKATYTFKATVSHLNDINERKELKQNQYSNIQPQVN